MQLLGAVLRPQRMALSLPHVARMLPAVKPDKVFDPTGIGLFSAKAIVQVANLLAQLIH